MTSPAYHPKAWAMWKKFTLGLAFALGVAGAALYIAVPEPQPNGALANPAPGPSTGTGTARYGIQSAQPSHFQNNTAQPAWPPVAGQAPPTAGATDNILMQDWSVLFMKLGFSFIIGFSIGYALAFFLKTTALILGVIALALFGLQYAGLASVNWGGMEAVYNGFLTWLHPHVGSFKEFITSNLSSSVLAAAGLVAGLTR